MGTSLGSNAVVTKENAVNSILDLFLKMCFMVEETDIIHKVRN